MNRIISKTAFTLLELIVTSVLVVIVILGIFAINSVLVNTNQDYGQRYSVKAATQVTLNHILNNASEAIGSGTNIPYGPSTVPDLGILSGSGLPAQGGMGDRNSFCIHQDIAPGPYNLTTTIDNAPVNSPPTTPPSYSSATQNSRWLCYTLYSPSNSCGSIPNCSSYQIWYCASTYNPSSSNLGAASCTGNSTATYLGTAYSINNPAPPSFNTTTGAFTITIQNYLNDSGNIQDTVNNPESQVTGSVIPSQEGLPQS